VTRLASSPPTARSEPRDRHIIAALAIGIAVAYLTLALVGATIVITRTLVVFALLLYALRLEERVAFVSDWLPFMCGMLLYDACRGAIYLLIQWNWRPIYAEYVIEAERLLTGRPAVPLFFVSHPILSQIAAAWYLSHFLMLLGFGLALWHLQREAFWRFRAAMLIVFAIGSCGYLLVPTAPPWMASAWGLLPTIARDPVVLQSVAPELIAAFDVNPVAAMPSVHLAVPTVYTLLGWSAFGRTTGIGLFLYLLGMAVAVMYSGNHYLVDVLMGIVVGWVGVTLAGSIPRGAPWPFSRVIVGCVVVLIATFSLSAAVQRHSDTRSVPTYQVPRSGVSEQP
jgi:hypothetical protein